MAKTQKELDALKEQIESLNKQLKGLSEEELDQICGGIMPHINASIIFNLLRNNENEANDFNYEEPSQIPAIVIQAIQEGNKEKAKELFLQNYSSIPERMRDTLMMLYRVNFHEDIFD